MKETNILQWFYPVLSVRDVAEDSIQGQKYLRRNRDHWIKFL